MSEELMVARDIKLARYANSKIHFTGISTRKSLEYIQRAKQSGIPVSCSITPYHLSFTDADLVQYDTNLKVFPPLRSETDRQALLKAVEDGIIDCVATHHQPHEWDSKTCEFEYAKPGMIGLETCFGVMGNLGISAEKFVDLVAVRPRKIFGLPNYSIQKNADADLTLFVPGVSYQFLETQVRSKSKNSAFIGRQMRGKVVGIINGNKLFLNQ
jgi:dihydroorotase